MPVDWNVLPVMVAERQTRLEMEVGQLGDDVLLTNRAVWLKHDQLSYMQKTRLKR